MKPDSREKFVLRKSSAFSCYRTVFLGQAPSASGTLQSSGSLNENTGAFNAQFSGSVSTVPEPSAISLVGAGIAIVGLSRSRIRRRFSLNAFGLTLTGISNLLQGLQTDHRRNLK